jgi:hypothetical protein
LSRHRIKFYNFETRIPIKDDNTAGTNPAVQKDALVTIVRLSRPTEAASPAELLEKAENEAAAPTGVGKVSRRKNLNPVKMLLEPKVSKTESDDKVSMLFKLFSSSLTLWLY